MVILGSVLFFLMYTTVSPRDKMLFMNQGVMFDTVRSVNINSVVTVCNASWPLQQRHAAFCELCDDRTNSNLLPMSRPALVSETTAAQQLK